MEANVKANLSNIFLRQQFRKEDAEFISALMHNIDEKQETNFMQYKDYFLNKNDKVELIEKISGTRAKLTEKIYAVRNDLSKSIYIAGLVQFMAIVGSVLAIVNFMLK